MGTFLNYTYEGADFVYGYLATGRPFLPEAYNHTGDAQLTAVVQTVLGDINTMGVMPAPFFFGPSSEEVWSLDAIFLLQVVNIPACV